MLSSRAFASDFIQLLVAFSAALLLAFTSASAAAQAPAAQALDAQAPSAPAFERFETAEAKPRVYVGMYLHDVSNLSISEGTYLIDADMWLKWRGDFNPGEVRFANAVEFDITSTVSESDGDWRSARWTIRGEFRGEFPVHDFPLDRQFIRIAIDLPTQYGELVPDLAGSGVSKQFSITDWSWAEDFRPILSYERFPSDLGSIATEGRSAEARRVTFEIALDRPSAPLILKLFLPLAILTLIVFLSLFVTPENLQPKLTMCVTGLVACFAFQFSVNDLIPSVPYLTLANVLFIIVYILAIVCVLSAVFGHVMLARGSRHIAENTQAVLRWVTPLVILLTVLWAIPSPARAPVHAIPELPQVERPSTARALVRIGTTAALEGFGSPVTPAVHWGLTRESISFIDDPIYVERIPSIDSGDQRFLSDGTLESTWRLRSDAIWSDGTPMLAADILAPLNTMQDPRLHSWHAIDDHSVIIRWNERVSEAIRSPRVWPSAQMQAAGALDDADARREFLRNPMRPSTGPYRVIEADEQKIVAERNPHFPLTPAAIERIEVYHFPDSASLAEALLKGDIDVASPNQLSTQDADRIAQSSAHAVEEITGAELTFLALPLREGPWVDPELRRALLQVFDRKRLVELEWPKRGVVAHAPTTATLPEGFRYIDYAAEDARATFEAAGVLGMTLRVQHHPTIPASILAQIQQDLENAGFIVELTPEERTARTWRGGEFTDILLHKVRIDPDAQLYRWWGLRWVDGAYVLDERNGAWGPEQARLLNQHQYALFPERREQLRERVQLAWGEQLPLIPLYFAGERIAVDPALRGWQREPRLPFGYGIEGWWFE